MQEIWKDLIYQNKYYGDKLEVSNLGNLRNKLTGTVYKKTVNKTGYYAVVVSLGGRNNKKMFRIHKCVAESFIPNEHDYPVINHIDGNKLNNNVDNLEWCTQRENIRHAIKVNLLVIKRGQEHVNAKLTNEIVEYIREHYMPNDKQFGCRALARKFGVTHGVVSDILQGKSWNVA